jgi:uncharacterized repeat protein (TIGR01451 family)
MIFSVIAVQSGYLKADKSLSQEIPSVNEQATPSQEDICDGVDSDQPTGSQLGISEIQVIKTIWDGSAWVKSAEAMIGSVVTFNITILYHKVCGSVATDIEVVDYLPSCLTYESGSATIYNKQNEYHGETAVVGQQIHWSLSETYGIMLYSESINPELQPHKATIIFDAIVTSSTEPEGSTNMAVVDCVETCCGEPMQGHDEATIIVPGECPQEANILVTKLVKEDSYGSYGNMITVDTQATNWVTFKIVVDNTGSIPLDVTVEDELPLGLTYHVGYATPREPDTIDGRMLYWYFYDVAPGEPKTITFRADIQDCDTYVNTVDVTGEYGSGQYVYDSDTAIVDAIGCCQSGDITVEKYVKEDCCGSYTEYLSVDINQFSYVTFKLVAHTTRAFEVVSIRDILPEDLSYRLGSAKVNGVYKAPVIRGTSLYWNYTSVVSGYTYTITFEASVNDCGFFTNRAIVKGRYDYSHWLTDDDTATVNVYGCIDRLDVEKLVSLDNNTWYDNVDAHIGDTLYFMINVSNKGTKTISGVTVKDYLPSLLEYNNDGVPTPVLVTEDELTWFYPDIYAHTYEIVRYSATIVKDGTDQNVVNAAACGGSPSGQDSVTIHAKAGMYVQKKVSKDGVTWADKITAAVGETVRFNLTIFYYGPYFIFHINVTDYLPYGLIYADDANPRETAVVGNTVYWRLPGFIGNASSISIEFNATVVHDGTHINRVNVSAQECSGIKLYDEDTAIVEVKEGPSLFCQKTVQATNGSWVKKIDAEVGDNVRFNITIKNIGYFPWYMIAVLDILPENMSYVTDTASLIYKGDIIVEGDDFRPAISDNQLLWNNLNLYTGDYLYSGETITVIFKAKVNEKELMTNRANITVLQCNLGTKFKSTDTAMVNGTETIPALVANAGGPYSGTVGSSITMTGSAQGGVSPYSYAWDLDNDGQYDDGTGKTVSKSWTTPGTYTIGLKVTDDRGTEDTDTAQVTIEEQNTAPNAPQTPEGATSGTAGEPYTYATKATDSQGDQVRYQWDWGDGTMSDWSQLYPSGVQVTATHTWDDRGTYQLRVRAQDEHGLIGGWSSYLEVTMPKSKHTSLLWTILEYLMEHFPFLERLLP